MTSAFESTTKDALLRQAEFGRLPVKKEEAAGDNSPHSPKTQSTSEEAVAFNSPLLPHMSVVNALNSPAMISLGDTPLSFSSSSLHQTPQADTHLTMQKKEGGSTRETSLFEDAVRTGQSYVAARNYAQALVCFGRALRYKHHTILKEPLETQTLFADVLFTIGEIHLSNQYHEPAKAIQAYQFCLDLRSACYGPKHAIVAQVLQKLAEVYAVIGESQTAVDILEEALAIMLALEDKSQAMAEVWTALGRQLDNLGAHEDAKNCFEEASKVVKALGTSFDTDRQTPVMRNQPS